ncbi:thiocillin family RiPP [Microbacterium sp. p3-SID338]|uniref:thiocillin family RiPP n=1 Tax=unclassified Microbacterium TaxID=2609290 RepID=UPI0015E0FB21|nr:MULTISPECIES: thiocillin family RiPP [unclassified Microbacterium]MCT1395253.1 thiocillin family RiPP [Microbacterium sp. p3-SID338]
MKMQSLEMVSIEELSVEDLPETVSAGASSFGSYACIGSAGTCAGTLSSLGSFSG